MEKQRKAIVIFSKNKEEGTNPIAVFDDPLLVGEFLSRPLAKVEDYEIFEYPINPPFSTENLPVWFVAINPRHKNPKRVLQINTFSEEIDAINGYVKKSDGILFINVFAKDKYEAAELGMKKMAELKASGEWKMM
ncbi:hypothetical protein [Pedobacter helvus]|uniref:SseB protein N-terminal domain-containing protein n=1 Tax=Pedobacter helvus TaxID=2563444 RepID=A0ABW9JCJ3_9SPHI|nr:hypothetical protein [Pedobacter ureilyticus]